MYYLFKNRGVCWHVHHDTLMEYCHSYKGRVAFIKKHKPKDEIPTRLHLFQPVKGKLPKKITREAWVGGFIWSTTKRKYYEEIKALHAKECPDCPWDGKTIFPKGEPK